MERGVKGQHGLPLVLERKQKSPPQALPLQRLSKTILLMHTAAAQTWPACKNALVDILIHSRRLQIPPSLVSSAPTSQA